METSGRTFLCLVSFAVVAGCRSDSSMRFAAQADAMRPAPSMSEDGSLHWVHVGERVKILESRDGWVRLRREAGQEGWLRSDHLAPTEVRRVAVITSPLECYDAWDSEQPSPERHAPPWTILFLGDEKRGLTRVLAGAPGCAWVELDDRKPDEQELGIARLVQRAREGGRRVAAEVLARARVDFPGSPALAILEELARPDWTGIPEARPPPSVRAPLPRRDPFEFTVPGDPGGPLSDGAEPVRVHPARCWARLTCTCTVEDDVDWEGLARAHLPRVDHDSTAPSSGKRGFRSFDLPVGAAQEAFRYFLVRPGGVYEKRPVALRGRVEVVRPLFGDFPRDVAVGYGGSLLLEPAEPHDGLGFVLASRGARRFRGRLLRASKHTDRGGEILYRIERGELLIRHPWSGSPERALGPARQVVVRGMDAMAGVWRLEVEPGGGAYLLVSWIPPTKPSCGEVQMALVDARDLTLVATSACP